MYLYWLGGMVIAFIIVLLLLVNYIKSKVPRETKKRIKRNAGANKVLLWPLVRFRYTKTTIDDIVKRFSKNVDFLTAHACDEWAMGNNPEVSQHKTIEERVSVAEKFKEAMDFTSHDLCVDLIDDNTNHAYSAYPERLYVVKNGKIVYAGGPGPFFYQPDELEKFLEDEVKNHQ